MAAVDRFFRPDGPNGQYEKSREQAKLRTQGYQEVEDTKEREVREEKRGQKKSAY
jgi:hypothetical protein